VYTTAQVLATSQKSREALVDLATFLIDGLEARLRSLEDLLLHLFQLLVIHVLDLFKLLLPIHDGLASDED